MPPPTKPPVRITIQNLARQGWSGEDILRMLTDPRSPSYEAWKAEGYKVPGIRTIQEIAREARAIDDSGEWTLATANPRTAGVVLDALADMSRKWESGIPETSRSVAVWIIRLRWARPDLIAWKTWMLASLYTLAAADNDHESLAALDGLVMYQPWVSWAAFKQYELAVAGSWVAKPAVMAPYPIGAVVPCTWEWFACADADWITDERTDNIRPGVREMLGKAIAVGSNRLNDEERQDDGMK